MVTPYRKEPRPTHGYFRGITAPIRCPRCGEIFPNQEQADRHYRDKHPRTPS